MKKLILIILSIFSIPVFGQVNYTHYSKAEVQQDLNFAFEKLISIHPLFLDEDELTHYQNKFSTIKKSLKDSMTQNEVYLFLAPLFASLNDGHTGVLVPTDQRVQYNNAGGKAFPFFVNIIDDSIYVSFYCGNDTSLFSEGEQILKINGIDATKMVHDMELLVAGKSAAIKQKEIANKFRFIIWLLYGFEQNYELTIKNKQHEIREITVPGITSTEFMQNIKRMPKTNHNNFVLSTNRRNETAVMKIKSFGDLNGFCAFAGSAFAEIKENGVKNLVIDIRNNGGGRSIVVDSLMNYITDKTYSQYKKIEIRISPELREHYKGRYPDRLDWINSYVIDDLVVPKRNSTKPKNKNLSYNGNLFLLTNKTTFSAAATFAGIFKELELGTIIGEETGGTIAYYGDFWMLKTPNTGITFYVSPKRFIQFGGTEYDRGVLPYYLISDKDDSIMDFTYKMIDKE
jgi:hypothetical protein